MAKLNPSTITLKGDPQGREALATGAITPGMLLAVAGANVAAHASAGAPNTAAFAREMDIVGGSIDDVYESGDTVLYSEFRKGDMVYALLADGENVGAGNLLESAGDGTLQALNSDAGPAEAASVDIGEGNAGVTFTANVAGSAGNGIQIEYLAADDETATITVVGQLIQIRPDNTTPGTTDAASTIVALVNGDPEASVLVTAAPVGTGASAVVTPVAATNLAGGTDAGGGHAIARAAEAVNNAIGETPVRIRVEVL